MYVFRPLLPGLLAALRRRRLLVRPVELPRRAHRPPDPVLRVRPAGEGPGRRGSRMRTELGFQKIRKITECRGLQNTIECRDAPSTFILYIYPQHLTSFGNWTRAFFGHPLLILSLDEISLHDGKFWKFRLL